MIKNYRKPTSQIDAATGELVIRVLPTTIAALTERWHRENSGESEHIRIVDVDALAEAVCANIHGHDEDWFPGDMSAIESWMGGSGCQAVFEDAALYSVIPTEEVVAERQVFFGEWSGGQRSNLIDDFDVFRTDLTGVEFVVATYEVTETTGAASVVFKRGGKFYMVIAANRDGEGIEGQWRPLEISVDDLRGHFLHPEGESSEPFLASLNSYLDELEAEAETAHEELHGSSRLEIYHASAEVLGTSLRGIATALHAMEKPDAIQHVRGLIDALQTAEGMLSERVIDNYGATVGVSCLAFRKVAPDGGYEAIIQDLPNVAELATHRYWTSLDFETTGLKPEDRVIQVGVVRLDMKTGERTEFQTLVDPEGMVSTDEAIDIHGITPERLVNAPRWGHVRHLLRGLLEDSLLVCQNIEFEKRFLESHGYEPNWSAEIDTKLLAQMYLPGLPSYSLGPIAEALGIGERVGGHHDALEDARMALAVFTAIVARLPDEEAETPAAA